ncbi:hypothetical protein SAMN05192529_11856 [Arachidicoccus rhizosphaerae]|jgi:hypothetical protein|uniref:Uncharacterized protein n=1 Tax=Arachidicoccus rhizosphaerae TaxID=551991 RepID=A0A1H4B595_9BACT|nr:hypothetical protein [Arachidicoccus rhizosphaerae]SEA43300.1 hypothetical protein SAMN05192529_11856 [Arachidicoccus rhizosphaerae]
MKSILYQFIFLQLILLMGLFSMRKKEYLKKWSWVSADKKHRVAGSIFMIEGILQIFIGWCFHDGTQNNIGTLLFYMGGLIWLTGGILYFIFGNKTRGDTPQVKLSKKRAEIN